jgi:hypothetical protein
MGLLPCLTDSALEEYDPLGEEEPMDDVAEYYEKDEDLTGEVPNYCDEEFCCVDFLGVDDILSDSHNSNCDDFYVDRRKLYANMGDNDWPIPEYLHGMWKGKGSREA